MPSAISTALKHSEKHYIVEHHEAPDYYEPIGYAVTWDASRKTPMPPPSRDKVRQVLKEEAKRMAFASTRSDAYKKERWDSERPAGLSQSRAVLMPYFELNWSAPPEAAVRLRDDQKEYVANPPPTSQVRAQRRERCAERAWETGFGRPYAPLGEVPLFPSQVRPGPRPDVLQIRGEIWRPPIDENADITTVTLGVPINDTVPLGASRFYSVEVPPRVHLHVELHRYSGDPDLFVSNTFKRPTSEQNQWCSNSTEQVDEVHIEPDDPNAEPGVYNIGVYGEKHSEFRLLVTTSKPPVLLPPRAKPVHTHGFATIGKQLRRSAARLTATSSGSAPPGALLSSALQSAAAPEESFLEAGRPAARVLRAHSGAAHSGAPRHEMLLSVSRSLSTLPLPSRGRPPSSLRGPMAEVFEERRLHSSSSSRRGLRPETPPDLQWQPPEGTSWSDLPRETRLEQALNECVQVHAQVQQRLEEQLSELEQGRALRYIARTHALSAVDPGATSIYEPGTVRKGAEWMVASYGTREGEEEEEEEPAEDASEASGTPTRLAFRDHPLVLAIESKFKPTPTPAATAGRRSNHAGRSSRAGS